MKLTRVRTIIEEVDFNYEIKEITLLSVEEYKKYRPIIPLLEEWWWLRSPGYTQNRAASVDHGGDVHEDGHIVSSYNLAVRPALKIQTSNLESFKIGDKLNLLYRKWTVLDIFENELYILCDENIDWHRFDKISNNWEKSELRLWTETQF